MELEDIQRQHNEVLHDLSDVETEVKLYFGGIGECGKLYTLLLRNQMDQLKHKHQVEMGKLSRDYDEKMLTLMRQLPPCGLKDSGEHKISEKQLLERLQIQQEELERCCKLQEELNAALTELEDLKRLQETVKNVTAPSQMSKLPLKLKKPVVKSPAHAANAVTDDDDDYNSEYNSDDDPEWRQTPMFKRIKKLREEAGVPPKMVEPVEKKVVSCGSLLTVIHSGLLIRQRKSIQNFVIDAG